MEDIRSKYKIFDSHAHYDDSQYDEDREEIIKNLKANNVEYVLNCGADIEGSRDSVSLSKKYDMFYGSVGIHPLYADKVTDEVLEELRVLAKEEKVVAIGEIGLDYFYEDSPSREVQKEAFIKQMQLAKELNMPVIIHDRDAHEDTLNILKEFPEVIGVVHCFSGSVEFARQCLALGYYLGFTGVVTFKNAKKALEVVKEIPLDKLLVETDAPYMAPTPYRGKRNRSEYIQYVIEKISEIKQITPEEISEITINNTKRLLKIGK